MTDRTAEFLYEVGHLERTPRSGYALLRQADQSVAAHSFRTAWVAWSLAEATEGASPLKAMAMAMVHDLPETRTTDLHHLAQDYVQVDELRALSDQLADVPGGESMAALHGEYRAGETLESRIVKDADRIELLLSLEERLSRGSAAAPPESGTDWIEKLVLRLQTEAARVLAQKIRSTHPSAWWNGNPAESSC